jgi:uncharacterized protein DUF6869
VSAVAEFIETEPEPVWSFARRWACSTDEDVRMAIATSVLEHLLEYHFDTFISRIEEAARIDRRFADTVSHCWKFGQTEDPAGSARFDRLKTSIREKTG